MATRGDLARELLVRAADDLAAATALLGAPDVSDAMVGFHNQQTVEKALKAVLAFRGVDFPYTHDLSALIELIEADEDTLPDGLAEVDLLTPLGVRLRYATVEDALLVSGETGLGWAELAIAWACETVR